MLQAVIRTIVAEKQVDGKSAVPVQRYLEGLRDERPGHLLAMNETISLSTNNTYIFTTCNEYRE